MAVQHTPAPWFVVTGTKVVAGKPKQHGGGKAICAIRPSRWTDAAVREAQANANLIAAAPELLAAIKDLLPHAEGKSAAFRGIAIRVAEAIIAKAEGRS